LRSDWDAYPAGMSSETRAVFTPRARRVGGLSEALVEPDLDAREAVELVAVIKALADPTRLRIVDALRKASPEAICQVELMPLFEMSQPALAKHLKILVSAGVIGSERRGLWAYYFVIPDRLREVAAWLA
jgi:ArsR family transcriptional regulator